MRCNARPVQTLPRLPCRGMDAQARSGRSLPDLPTYGIERGRMQPSDGARSTSSNLLPLAQDSNPTVVDISRLGQQPVFSAEQVLLPGTTDKFLLISYGLQWIEVTAGNLLTVQATADGTCKVLYGRGIPETTAFWIHSRIHLARPEAAAVCFHTHMPWTTALCCLEDPT